MACDDFAPSSCSALLIQACIAAKRCALLESLEFLDFDGLDEKFGGLKGNLIAARLVMDAQFQCLYDTLRDAFDEAGCPFPNVPAFSAAPAMLSCDEISNFVQANIADPLMFLGGVITIDLDPNDLPTRIQVP